MLVFFDGIFFSGTGIDIIRQALYVPCRQIAFNAGVDADAVVTKVASLPRDEGYNALTGEFVDMIKAGIIDPTKASENFPSNQSINQVIDECNQSINQSTVDYNVLLREMFFRWSGLRSLTRPESRRCSVLRKPSWLRYPRRRRRWAAVEWAEAEWVVWEAWAEWASKLDPFWRLLSVGFLFYVIIGDLLRFFRWVSRQILAWSLVWIWLVSCGRSPLLFVSSSCHFGRRRWFPGSNLIKFEQYYSQSQTVTV